MHSPIDKSSATRDAAALLLLALVVSLPIAAVVYGGQAPLPDYLRHFAAWSDGEPAHTAWNALWYDAIGQYWPWRTLLHDGLRHNQVPWWNPYAFSGYAFAGNGQSALLYPLNWLFFGLFSVAGGFRLTALCHLWLSAAGVYWLLRELGARRAAALVGGTVFALSGFQITWLMLPTLLSSAAWLAPAAALVERARRTRGPACGALAGCCVGLSALAGHPQVWYYVALTVAVVAVVRLWRASRTALVACAAVAGMVSAAALLPVFELAPRSHRPPGKSVEARLGFDGRAIPATRLVTLFLPGFYGSPERGTVFLGGPAERALRQAADGAYWGLNAQSAISPGDYTEFNVFVGLVPLLLWLVALGTGPTAARLYGGLALAALLLAFGLWPNRVLYWMLPGYAAGAGPCRLALIWCFGVAVAAGLGCDRAGQARSARGREGWLGPGVAAVGVVGSVVTTRAALAVGGLGPLLEVTLFRHLLAASAALLLLAVAAAAWRRAPQFLPLLAMAELVYFGWAFNPSCPPRLLDPRPPQVAALADRLAATGTRALALNDPLRWGFYAAPVGSPAPPNLLSAAGVRDAGGYDSLLPAATKQRYFVAAGEHHPSPAINGNMLLLGGVDPRLAGGAAGVLVTAGAAGLAVRTAEAAPPSRCLMVPADGEEAYLPPSAFVVDTPNRITLRVTGGAPLLRDAPDPGWRCLVGAEGSTALRRVAWSVRGPRREPRDQGRFVATASGASDSALRVQWVFAPTVVRVGVFLLLLGCAMVSALLVAGRPAGGGTGR